MKDFKAFWKKQGPFKYALTSAEFPPVLLEPEEWIFSDNIISLLKELMQWNSRNISIVKAPFNKNKKNILKPETLSPWRIEHFPQEWESAICETFTPVGYLTEAVTSEVKFLDNASNTIQKIEDKRAVDKSKTVSNDCKKIEPTEDLIENAFFQSLEKNIGKIGYVLLGPEPLVGEEDAYIDDYIQEWQADEDDG